MAFVIRILSSDLVNQIAAGEVIERPASVVKELVENAIDAGSSKIEVFVQNGGLSYISVKDNGNGMSLHDLELCVQRHATSKLLGKNLLDIRTFGFRGEALPSICSISRVDIKTATPDGGWSLSLDGGVEVKKEPTRLDCGTVVSVRDLFYKTPARLKFLKSTSAELAACALQVKLLALSNPQVAFSFVSESKCLFSYEDPSKRIQDVMGLEFYQNGVSLQGEQGGVALTGIVSCPTYHRNDGQHIFVNKRPVKDRFLAGAVKVPYQNVLIPGEQPSYVLFLNLDPQDVDVNVHPAKTEVRFRTPGRVRSAVISMLEEALSTTRDTATTLADQFISACVRRRDAIEWRDVEIPQAYVSGAVYASALALEGKNVGIKEIKETIDASNVVIDNQNVGAIEGSNVAIESSNVGVIDGFTILHPDEDERPPELSFGVAKAQIFDSFIITQNENEMFLVDQHAAHERIVYEQLDKYLCVDSFGEIVWTGATQQLIFPIRLDILKSEGEEDIAERLRNIGFGCCYNNEHLSNPSSVLEEDSKHRNGTGQECALRITSIPKICESLDIVALIREIAADLATIPDKSTFLARVHKIFATHACHNSVRANHPLNNAEMDALLRQMENTKRSGQCNHGRPAYVKLLRKDIERLFARTG
jgi:DNA mismatch repair protein MutL